MQHRIRNLRMRTLVWLAVLVAIPALPGAAMAQTAAAPEAGAQALTPRLLAEASWHGRPIRRPFARRSDVSDEGASLRPGTGFSRAGGSRRVRELQRRLNRLGYRPGPSDGLFGPRTQAAVLAFQRKHGLARTGAVGPATLRVLRRRTASGAEAPAPAPADRSSEASSSTPRTQPQAPIRPARATDDGLPALVIVLLVALAIPLVMAAGLLLRSRRGRFLEPAPEPPVLPWGFDPPRELPEPSSPPATDPLPGPEERELAVQPEHPAVPEPQEEPRIRRVPPPRHVPADERRQALRERILAMRAEGMTLQEIADQLTAEGEVTPGGGRRWQPWTVRAASRPIVPRGGPSPQHRHGRR